MAPAQDSMTAQQAAELLAEAQDRFIASWGRMGSAWGISRTMAEVHALLYVTGEPMCTDEIMDRLAISRGNVSMSVRALLEWGVIQRTHKRGDRKDYFQAEQDVWAMLRAIARERIKREVDPLLQSLEEIRALTPDTVFQGGKAKGRATPEDMASLNDRLDAVQECFELMSVLSHKFAGPTGTGLKTAAKLLAKMPTRNGSKDAPAMEGER
jgi:HTH-type transcriptional regulator, glycine betaine synthesis regulator